MLIVVGLFVAACLFLVVYWASVRDGASDNVERMECELEYGPEHPICR